MCTSPIQIISRSKRFVDLQHRLFQSVPCGKCDSCRERIINDWQVRCYAEMLNTKRYGGRTIFLTLTYKPNCRPYLIHNDIDEYGKPYKFFIPCFSKRDVIRFVRSFTRHLYRTFFPNSVKRFDGVKYFIASEYGKDENGERCPHYHLLLHIPQCSASDVQLSNLARRCWSVMLPKDHPLRGKLIPHKDLNGNYIMDKDGKLKLYRKVRQSLGFVLISDKGLVVESPFACSYVGKYCCKDLDFYNHPEVSKYLNPMNPNYLAHKDKIKDKLPRHYQSHYYGASLLDTLDIDFNQAMENGFRICNDVDKIYSLPRYIIDKEIYYTDDFGRRFLNETGRNYFLSTFDKRIKVESSNIERLCTSLSLVQLSPAQLLCFPRPKLSNFTFDINAFNLSSFLKNLLSGRSLELALYHQVWQNRTCLEKDVFDNIDNYTFEQFVSQSKSLYNFDINILPEDYPVIDLNAELDIVEHSPVSTGTDEFIRLRANRFNQCYRFKHFDYLLEAVSYIQCCINKNTLTSTLNKRKEKERAKYILKHSQFKIKSL